MNNFKPRPGSKLTSVFIAFCLLISGILQSQISEEYTIVNTNSGNVKIPGQWQKLSTEEDSGQTFFVNSEKVIFAVAQNAKKAYPFFTVGKKNFEYVTEFYTWDSDYMIKNNFKTSKIKENPKQEYIIWKYNAGKLDNLFLFGSNKEAFLNLLVYTDKWSENEKILFLEKIYKLNKDDVPVK
ncbi:hypothetical protein H1R16_05680 [Marnyiella aurantia]|uniref:Uncharacterized protein n=1 Tax=Marnyiella aurantia TaxID=2758037 RepID=A0A7D7QU40_9FLAO|nr:hypothetical protein [Marnyiella aurantia]MBA5247867.1 hypothetical protein [Marnyiella aurantia]QMS99488.1 hypothetical protein H1R16_05680 [Marnyiella aurantia]